MSFLSKTLGKIVGAQTAGQNTQSAPTSQSSAAGQAAGKAAESYHQHPAAPSGRHAPSSVVNTDAQLTRTHLRKIFYDYLNPKHPHMNESDRRDDKLYCIMPLFIKIHFLSSSIKCLIPNTVQKVKKKE